MLEILVTLFLLTMWLLASAGVQSSSLQFNKAAQFRTQAVYLATDLAERMQANSAGAVAGSYVIGQTTVTAADAGTACMAGACSANRAGHVRQDRMDGARRRGPSSEQHGLRLDHRRVRHERRDHVPPNPMITYTIVISWSDRRTDGVATGSTETFSYTATKTIFDQPT